MRSSQQSRILLAALALGVTSAAPAGAQDTAVSAVVRVPVAVKMVNGLKAWNDFLPHVQPRFEGGECRRLGPNHGVRVSLNELQQLPQFAALTDRIKAVIERCGSR